MIISAQFVSDSQADRLDILSQGLKGLGVDYVSHVVLSPSGVWTCYATHPKWGQQYLESEMFRFEPITRLVEQSSRSVLAWEFIPSTADKNGVLKARAQACQISKGVTVATNYGGLKEFFALGFSSDQVELGDFLTDHSTLIKNYIQMFRNEHTFKRIEK